MMNLIRHSPKRDVSALCVELAKQKKRLAVLLRRMNNLEKIMRAKAVSCPERDIVLIRALKDAVSGFIKLLERLELSFKPEPGKSAAARKRQIPALCSVTVHSRQEFTRDKSDINTAGALRSAAASIRAAENKSPLNLPGKEELPSTDPAASTLPFCPSARLRAAACRLHGATLRGE